jgi:spore coat protein CotH
MNDSRFLRSAEANMTRFVRTTVTLLLVSAPLLACAAVTAPGQPAKPAKPDPLFETTKLHSFHLELTSAAYQQMQPSRSMGFPPVFLDPDPWVPRKPVAKPDKPADVHKSAGAFATEFPWVKGELTFDGKTLKNIGVRYKGNFTYISSAHMLRRPLKIELDHYDETHKIHGRQKLNFNNGATDGARAREAVAFAFYRAAGVPASRTAFAELTVTIPGKYDKELVGLYTLVEQVDKTFLKTHFKNSDGMLLKPENLRGGIEYMGEDWSRYEQRYRPRKETTKEQQQRLIAFARLVNKGSDADFAKEIGGCLDVDAFLRFVAADALLANLDSFLGFGHNFFLYLRPTDNRFVFIPWDLDLSLGMWPVGGTPDQQTDLSLDHPHIGQNKLIDRLFAIKEHKDKYMQLVREMAATSFTKEALFKHVDAVERVAKEPLAREAAAQAARKESARGGQFGGMIPQTPLRGFLEKRTLSVQEQLAGARKGYVPRGMMFGPPMP